MGPFFLKLLQLGPVPKSKLLKIVVAVLFYKPDPFLSPNQQRQSTDTICGKGTVTTNWKLVGAPMSFFVSGCLFPDLPPLFLLFFLLIVPLEVPTPVGIVFICIGATKIQQVTHRSMASRSSSSISVLALFLWQIDVKVYLTDFSRK